MTLNYKKELSLDYIKTKVAYNPKEGVFYRLNNNSKVTFSEDCSALIQISKDSKRYRIPANKLAWYITYGKYPEDLVMHKDMDKYNFKIDNLQQVTIGHLNRVNSIYNCLKQGISVYQSEKDMYTTIVEYNDGEPKKKSFANPIKALLFREELINKLKIKLLKLGVNAKVVSIVDKNFKT